MLKHIVFWKINQGGSAEARQATVDAFRQKTAFLQTIIPQIKEAVVGVNVSEGDCFHVCIDSKFDSMEDLECYINHPEHLKVREFMNSVSYDKAVFDYYF